MINTRVGKGSENPRTDGHLRKLVIRSNMSFFFFLGTWRNAEAENFKHSEVSSTWNPLADSGSQRVMHHVDLLFVVIRYHESSCGGLPGGVRKEDGEPNRPRVQKYLLKKFSGQVNLPLPQVLDDTVEVVTLSESFFRQIVAVPIPLVTHLTTIRCRLRRFPYSTSLNTLWHRFGFWRRLVFYQSSCGLGWSRYRFFGTRIKMSWRTCRIAAHRHGRFHLWGRPASV